MRARRRLKKKRKAKESAERERKEREKKEADKREADKKKQDEQKRLAEARDRQAREATELKAQAERERAARDAQQRVNEAEAAARSSAEADYIRRIQAKVKGNVTLPPDMSGNPEAIFEVVQLPTGEIIDAVLRKSSGVRAYDDAVQRAIQKSSPLPRPDRPSSFSVALRLNSGRKTSPTQIARRSPCAQARTRNIPFARSRRQRCDFMSLSTTCLARSFIRTTSSTSSSATIDFGTCTRHLQSCCGPDARIPSSCAIWPPMAITEEGDIEVSRWARLANVGSHEDRTDSCLPDSPRRVKTGGVVTVMTDITADQRKVAGIG